jgi:kumamolisin
LWAGLIAVANQQNGKSAGFIEPAIYAAQGKAAFRDIDQGDNGSFRAAAGWDACTGLGSPIAPQVIKAVKPTSSQSRFKLAASRRKTRVRRTIRATRLADPSRSGFWGARKAVVR